MTGDVTGRLSLLLIALSFAALIGFGFSGLLVSQAHARRKKRETRLRAALAPFRKTLIAELQAFRPAEASNRSLVEMLAAVFGFNPARQNQYPVKWWIMLPATFIVARIGAGFVVDLLGPLGLVGLPLLWVGMCRAFFGWAVGRRKEALVRQFPDALAMVVRSVRVGIPVLGAIAAVSAEAQSPTSVEFGRFASDLAIGMPIDEAATDMGIRNDLAEYRFFAIAVGLQAQTGGGLSETLENLADLIRKRLALRERGLALSSEARTSSLILGGLPAVVGGGLYLLNPGYMSVLFTTSVGNKMLGALMVSLACGALSMRAIIKKSLS